VKFRIVFEVITEDFSRHVLTRQVDWPVIPREGNYLELAPGWCDLPVKSVEFKSSGEPTVSLIPAKNWENETLANLKREGQWEE